MKKDIRKPLVGPFTLIHVNGDTYIADTLDELKVLCSKIRIHERHVSNNSYIAGIDFFNGFGGDWICRDLYGQIVIEDDYRPKFVSSYYHRKHNKQFIRAVELGLPIPDTRCRRGGYSGWYRTPKHKSVITQNFVYDEDRDYNIKGYIEKENLPRDAWDDIGRSDWHLSKSWKKNRKHQWKG